MVFRQQDQLVVPLPVQVEMGGDVIWRLLQIDLVPYYAATDAAIVLPEQEIPLGVHFGDIIDAIVGTPEVVLGLAYLFDYVVPMERFDLDCFVGVFDSHDAD